MLDRDERRRFNEIVAALHAEDPGFAARSAPPGAGRRARLDVWAVVLLGAAPLLIMLAGWAGLAVLLTGCCLAGWHLVRAGGRRGHPH